MRPANAFAAALLLFATACATAPPQAPPRIDAAIETVTASPPFANALWGIVIEDESGRSLYARNADVLMMPASNRKLFTAATVAACDPLDLRIATAIRLRGAIDGGTLLGDIVIAGDGDPSLGGRHFPDSLAQFAPAVAALRDRGVRRVAGRVIADVSRFGADTLPGSWKNDNLADAYAAAADALAFHENAAALAIDRSTCPDPVVAPDPPFTQVIDLLECGENGWVVYGADAQNRITIDGVVTPDRDDPLQTEFPAVRDPALYAAQSLHAALAAGGIAIAEEPAVSRAPLDGEALAVIESPPLSELLAVLLKNSQNLYAEMLLKRIAPVPVATYPDALARERIFLESEAGLPRGSFEFGDGSGLSVENLVTPRSLVRIVRYMHAPERRGVFDALLAGPAEDGTLRNRLGALDGRFRGKTGSIDQVNALSGLLVTDRGELRYFSIVINHHTAGSRAGRAAIDAIVDAIAKS